MSQGGQEVLVADPPVDPDVHGVAGCLPIALRRDARIEEVLGVEVAAIGDRSRIRYRLRVRNPEGLFIGEQQA
jgi:hypothetical protein